MSYLSISKVVPTDILFLGSAFFADIAFFLIESVRHKYEGKVLTLLMIWRNILRKEHSDIVTENISKNA